MRYLAKVVLVFAVFCASHVDAEPVALACDFRRGPPTSGFRSNERASESSTGKQASRSITPLSLTVLKATKEAFLVELRYGKSELSMSAERPEVQRFLKDAQEIVQSLKFRVVIDKQGQIQDLQTLKRFRRQSESSSTSSRIPSRMPARAGKKPVAGNVQFRQVIVGVLLKDVPLLFVGAGADPNARTPVRFDSEMSNPFGGEHSRPLV